MQSAISVLRVMRRWGRENKMTDQELLELAAREYLDELKKGSE